MFTEKLALQLANLKQQGLYRSHQVIDSPQGIQLLIQGRQIMNFCSNDYLGLANDPQIIQALQQGSNTYGVGSGSAHLICGHSRAHYLLEQELAEFTGRERALLFSTGYMANLGIISALIGKNDFIFEDKLNHASLLDGALLSTATFKRYRHLNIEQLIVQLNQNQGEKLIVTDGVFSMDGDFAPLPDLVKIARDYSAILMVDDAHGFGVLGENGGGISEYYQLNAEQLPILMGTLGKAVGTFGAFVAGSELLIETLIQKSRSYIYTTAFPAAIAEATRCSLRLIKQQSWRRLRLQSLIDYFRNCARQLELPVMNSISAIQPILIGDNFHALKISQQLLELGFLVTAIRPPTVPKNQARLRITLSALHSESQIEQLLTAIHHCYHQLFKEIR